MTRQIPVYDVGLNESLDVQRRKQKAIADELGTDVGGGEKLFLIQPGFLVSSTRGIIPPNSPEYQRSLEQWRRAVTG